MFMMVTAMVVGVTHTMAGAMADGAILTTEAAGAGALAGTHGADGMLASDGATAMADGVTLTMDGVVTTEIGVTTLTDMLTTTMTITDVTHIVQEDLMLLMEETETV